MMLSSLQWRIIKLVGYPTFFILCFAVFMLWTFPVDRFAPQVEERLAAMLGREVSIGELSMSLTGAFTLEAVEIGVATEDGDRAEPEIEADGEPPRAGPGGKAADKPAPRPKYSIEEIDVDIGFLDILFGQLDVEVESELLGGELTISYEGPLGTDEAEQPGSTVAARRAAGLARRGLRPPADESGQPGVLPAAPADSTTVEEAAAAKDSDPMELSIAVTGIQLRQILDLRREVPVPIGGALDFHAELSSETGRFADAGGRISVAARQLKIGDSKNPANIGGMPMTVDEVLISELTWEIEVKEGVGTVEKFTLASTDFDAKIEGTIAFGDPFSHSRLDLYFMFKFLEGYAKKSPTATMLVSSLPDLSSAFKRALRSDGFFGFRYRGVLGTAQFTPSKFYRGKGGRDSARPDRKTRRSAGTQPKRTLDVAPPPPIDQPPMPPDRADANGKARSEVFPDLKPAMGSGRFGVDPVPPPPAPEESPDLAEKRRQAEIEARAGQGPPQDQVEVPESPPQPEQPQEQPEEAPPDQPAAEDQVQEEVAPETLEQ
jgi:hypothetical protein